jgi:hypothetical protein
MNESRPCTSTVRVDYEYVLQYALRTLCFQFVTIPVTRVRNKNGPRKLSFPGLPIRGSFYLHTHTFPKLARITGKTSKRNRLATPTKGGGRSSRSEQNRKKVSRASTSNVLSCHQNESNIPSVPPATAHEALVAALQEIHKTSPPYVLVSDCLAKPRG